MARSNYLSRRSHALESDRDERGAAARHGSATILAFVVAGAVPLVAHLVPLAAACARGSRAPVTRLDALRRGLEMLAVGALAACVAYRTRASAAAFTSSHR